MEEVKFRTATTDDLETLFEFEQGIIVAERPFNSTLKEGHINYYDLKAIIEADDSEVIVGTIDNKVVCSASVSIKEAKPYLKYEKYAYLGFMFVKPAFRGRGLNKGIIAELKNWAKAKGLSEARLTVYTENEAAIKAYEKAGFEKLIVEMRLGLD
ncbi:GNAT family N-acetyltransferase [Arcticibacterium luteifluviistationis]|uniref:GNAT family N-acetyltransferase n=1 Tax=Arcticibacterium luteifluviistationis TaxID=1784714 RepID=A0A2Z4GCA8_9BACT|nr:GNAT family N-acetyltransferase [Arcticibacterium luteifluviistationis]AWV98720.1 GNAT family N-acetyltransferase [Arcticibacterium luteifluviistationis]